MSKYISRTKSKLKFKRIAESEIEQLQGDPMSNKVLADIIRRREALRNQQAQRVNERERMLQAMRANAAPAHSAPQPKLDEFEKEYEAFIAEQRRLKEEREAKEAAAKAAEVEAPVETLVEEVKDDVVSEEDTTSENSEEIQVVETKPKKKSKKKKVVETIETVE